MTIKKPATTKIPVMIKILEPLLLPLLPSLVFLLLVLLLSVFRLSTMLPTALLALPALSSLFVFLFFPYLFVRLFFPFLPATLLPSSFLLQCKFLDLSRSHWKTIMQSNIPLAYLKHLQNDCN